jgi:hypothetical protein
MQPDNPPLSPLVRLYTLVVIAVFAFAVSPLFMPEAIGPRWPWPLTPFTSRFVGAIYTGLGWTMVIFLFVNRWSPGRLIFIGSLVFTGILTIVTFLHLGRFDWSKLGTPIWFVAYLGSDAFLIYFLWRYGGLPSPARPLAEPWRRFYGIQALIFGLYGLALVAIPSAATAWWPWPIDVFYAQVYSAVFVALAASLFLLALSAHWLEMLVIGIFQAIFGVTAIGGVLVADASLGKVNWSAAGSLIWTAAFAAMAVLGLISVGAALNGRARMPVAEPA